MQFNSNTISAPQAAARSNRGRLWKWIAGGIGALLLIALVATGYMFWRMSYIPADLDLATASEMRHALPHDQSRHARSVN